ncbi:MAG: S41 family peptidase [Chitinophagaceae bacterium]|nr:S41 family peptidase [Chitinophagaceae bacterium]
MPGKKLYNKPIYILTSGRTFSGAEELAYDYQNLKRAVIIGETTGGGANPRVMRADSSFVVFVPNGRAINPITKTNWEGVGVKPDTLVAAPFALYAARLMDYKTRLKKEKAFSGKQRWNRLSQKWKITGLPCGNTILY